MIRAMPVVSKSEVKPNFFVPLHRLSATRRTALRNSLKQRKLFRNAGMMQHSKHEPRGVERLFAGEPHMSEGRTNLLADRAERRQMESMARNAPKGSYERTRHKQGVHLLRSDMEQDWRPGFGRMYRVNKHEEIDKANPFAHQARVTRIAARAARRGERQAARGGSYAGRRAKEAAGHFEEAANRASHKASQNFEQSAHRAASEFGRQATQSGEKVSQKVGQEARQTVKTGGKQARKTLKVGGAVLAGGLTVPILAHNYSKPRYSPPPTKPIRKSWLAEIGFEEFCKMSADTRRQMMEAGHLRDRLSAEKGTSHPEYKAAEKEFKLKAHAHFKSEGKRSPYENDDDVRAAEGRGRTPPGGNRGGASNPPPGRGTRGNYTQEEQQRYQENMRQRAREREDAYQRHRQERRERFRENAYQGHQERMRDHFGGGAGHAGGAGRGMPEMYPKWSPKHLNRATALGLGAAGLGAAGMAIGASRNVPKTKKQGYKRATVTQGTKTQQERNAIIAGGATAAAGHGLGTGLYHAAQSAHHVDRGDIRALGHVAHMTGGSGLLIAGIGAGTYRHQKKKLNAMIANERTRKTAKTGSPSSSGKKVA